MKKWFLIILTGSILVFCCYALLYNGISNIKRMKIETYNHKEETYDQEKVVKDQASIKIFTKSLNRARHEKKTIYEMANHEDYLVTVTYENGGTDEFRVWETSGRYTHIIRAREGDNFKISGDKSRKKLIKLLN
jgi:cellulose synthase/poly-beta-1,6-N-acetylglucosamine synthase-like glycosyltransferase